MENDKQEWFGSLRLVIIVVTIAIVVRTLLFSPIIVDGPSMLPTLEDRDQMIINKFVYRIKNPERFDIVVFHASKDEDFIKRIIGLPGEHIAIEDGKLYVDNKQIDETFLIEGDIQNQQSFRLENLPGSYDKIPEGYVLVLGDNRNNSIDSRRFGLVKTSDVVGKASIIYWPLNRIQNVK